MNRTLPLAGAIAAAIVASTALAACGPEKMTTSQACSAWRDLARNAPTYDDVVEAEYYLPHYQELSRRIDGALGPAFADMATAQEIIIAEGGTPHVDDPAYENWFSYWDAGIELWRICDS